jgi:hypothetical protein
MRTKLTPSFCQKAIAEAGRERSIYWDATMPGFGLLVTNSGHRSFVVQYRATGRSRRMTIDSVLGLVKARQRAKTLLGAAASNRDPLEERRKAATRTEDTFEAIADNYLAWASDPKKSGKPVPRTLEQRQAMLKRLVYPTFGKRAIQEIRRSEIVKLLDSIASGSLISNGKKIEGGPVLADRTLAAIRKIMNWHAGRSDDFRSPIVRDMARTKSKERARNRILTHEELRAVWTRCVFWTGP